MSKEPSRARDRAETRAAQQDERAAAVWAQLEAEQKAVEERMARLRAARLARKAEK